MAVLWNQIKVVFGDGWELVGTVSDQGLIQHQVRIDNNAGVTWSLQGATYLAIPPAQVSKLSLQAIVNLTDSLRASIAAKLLC